MLSLADPDLDLAFDRPWFPGLAERLVGPVLSHRRLTAAGYRTRRWLNAEAAEFAADDAPSNLFEEPPPSLIGPYAAMGLRFAPPPGTPTRALLQEAWACLHRVPGAGAAAAALVRSIHVLEAPGPGYDVSHSDPALPCSIFLSLPAGEPNAALRAAESILHEAMHLQLTLIEAEAPIAKTSAATLFSPWQQRDRPVVGLVHGLYVFASIDAFLAERLVQGDLAENTAAFARKRRREIAEEIGQAADVARHQDLTPFGARFVNGLLAGAAKNP